MYKQYKIQALWPLLVIVLIGLNACIPSSEPAPKVQPPPARDLSNDVFIVPDSVRQREQQIAFQLNTPSWNHTSDFMLGTVTVAIILPRCVPTSKDQRTLYPCTETWNDVGEEIDYITEEIQNALAWWEQEALMYGAEVSFQIVPNHPVLVSTSYEPINLAGGGAPCGQEELWINEIMANLGYNSYSSYVANVRDYNNALREQYHTDWAFTIFVADASNDAIHDYEVDPDTGNIIRDGRGMFATNLCGGDWAITAWAWLAGPFTGMNNINNGYGSIFIDGVLAHEIGHIFGAPDEVNSWSCKENTAPTCSTQFGYLGGENQNCDPCLGNSDPSCENNCVSDVDLSLMRYPDDFLTGDIMNIIHEYTHQQIGWTDYDNNDRPDLLDTTPNITLIPPSNPTNTITPQYNGTTEDITFPTTLPFSEPWRPAYEDITINKLAGVEYRVDGGAWQPAISVDGGFDSSVENFLFSPLLCEDDTYTIQARAINSSGNYSIIQSHAITVSTSELCQYTYLPLMRSSRIVQPLISPDDNTPQGGYPLPSPSPPYP